MTEFELGEHARIDRRVAVAQREFKVMEKRANEEISRIASRHIRSMGQLRRFWNAKNKEKA
jgi:hypothetical protein